MAKTNIEYTDQVSNPLRARPIGDETNKIGTFCEKPDPDGTCKNCWAEVINERWGNGFTFDRANRDKIEWIKREKEMDRLLMLNKQKMRSGRNKGNPLMVFCCDTFDLFQPSITDELRDWIFDNYDTCTNLTLQIQTTYTSLMRKYFEKRYGDNDLPAHYWIGMSAGNQPWFNRNVEHLVKIRAKTRYVIFEPLVGPVSMLDADILRGQWGCDGSHHGKGTQDCPRELHHHHDEKCQFPIQQVIVGGESGINPRPIHPAWVRGLRHECRALKIAFFFKQWGEYLPISEMTSDEVDSCYHELPKNAPPDQTKREKIKSTVLQLDGTQNRSFPEGAMQMFKIGKHKAGRKLDGLTYLAFPDANREQIAFPIVDRSGENNETDPEILVILPCGFRKRFWLTGLSDDEYIYRAVLIKAIKAAA